MCAVGYDRDSMFTGSSVGRRRIRRELNIVSRTTNSG